jgi:hypothetical protein
MSMVAHEPVTVSAALGFEKLTAPDIVEKGKFRRLL